MITNTQAAAVKALAATAPGIGYNIWDVDGAKTEIRPFCPSPLHPDLFAVSTGIRSAGEWNATGISALVALALVREAACRGKEIMLWQCCACGDKAASKALGHFVSHGYCPLHAAQFRAEALAASK